MNKRQRRKYAKRFSTVVLGYHLAAWQATTRTYHSRIPADHPEVRRSSERRTRLLRVAVGRGAFRDFDLLAAKHRIRACDDMRANYTPPPWNQRYYRAWRKDT